MKSGAKIVLFLLSFLILMFPIGYFIHIGKM